MGDKRDYLSLCNERGDSETSFMADNCSRCFQAECSRSLSGKSRFENRISDWEERLFSNVPRMMVGDPRFPTLSGKRFVEVPTGRIPEIGQASMSRWMDPRELDVQTPSIQVETPAPSLVPAPEPVLVVPAPEVEAPAIPVPTQVLQPRPLNPPRQRGQMLGGPPPPAATAQDSWAVRPQETKGLPVVRPGARIKLGSGV